MSIKRIFHDPIHKEIVFDSGKPEELMIMELIDTVAFQRLRRIKQLGAASLVFHGAESSRFTHSIGVFCIARKIYQRLIESKSSFYTCLLYTSPSPRDKTVSRMPSSA